MAKFSKKIVSPGVHLVSSPLGKKVIEVITPARIKTWKENNAKMLALGARIPAPFFHQDASGTFPTPIVIGDDGASLQDAYTASGVTSQKAWDSSINSGYWEQYEQDASGALVAVVDAEGDTTDDKTPAGKIGKTYKEASIYVLPKATIRGKDGQLHEIGEHIAHTAIVLEGQEKGQENFKELVGMAQGMVFSMSDNLNPAATTAPAPGAAPGTATTPEQQAALGQDQELDLVKALLANPAVTIVLPSTTTRESLVGDLILILTQKIADDQKAQSMDAGLTQRPEDATTRTPSIAMSNVTTQGQATLTPEQQKLGFLMSMVSSNHRDKLKKRRDAILARAPQLKEFIEKTIDPKIAAFAMSDADLTKGDNFKSDIEEILDGLDAATPNLAGPSEVDWGTGSFIPTGAEAQVPPLDLVTGQAGDDLADATADSLLDQFLVI